MSAALAFSPSRVAALVRRHLYLLGSSWTRLAEIAYWPTVQLLTWGFIQSYVGSASNSAALAAGTFVGAVLLWDALFRAQLGYSVSFLEESWSRNLPNLLMSPLRPVELVAALMTMSVIRLALGLIPAFIVAQFAFGFGAGSLGFALVGFLAALIVTGWAVALIVSGLVLRLGMAAENLAWTFMFVLLPLACVYYPVATLPAWLQPVAWSLPPTHVFEGMRALLIEGRFRPGLLAGAFALDALWLAVAGAVFLTLLRRAREAGTLLGMGE